jgi:hypothetical protein
LKYTHSLVFAHLALQDNILSILVAIALHNLLAQSSSAIRFSTNTEAFLVKSSFQDGSAAKL